MADDKNKDEGEIVVDLDLDDGTSVTCDFVTILNVEGKSYIALTPRTESDEDDEIDVWFYELIGDVEDLSKEPELVYIEDDETYEKVTDAFDEYLDTLEFNDMLAFVYVSVNSIFISLFSRAMNASFSFCPIWLISFTPLNIFI